MNRVHRRSECGGKGLVCRVLGTTLLLSLLAAGVAQAQNAAPEFYESGSKTSEVLTSTISNPRFLEFDSAGNLYVSSTSTDSIHKYDGTTWIVFTTGTGSGSGILSNPYGLAIDASDNVYVSEKSGNIVKRFASDGSFDAEWSAPAFSSPYGLVLDSSGNLYVADSGNGQVQKFDGTTWSVFASGIGTPRDVAVDSLDNVYVAAKDDDTIYKYNSAGGLLTSWDSSVGAPMDKSSPARISIDADDNIYVIHGSWEGQTIYAFDTSGVYQDGWTEPLFSTQTFDVAFDQRDDRYVSDVGNGEIHKFSYDLALGASINVTFSVDGTAMTYNTAPAWRDDDGDTMTWSISSAASNGAATVVDGDVSYAPTPGYYGADAFTVQIDDGNGGTDTLTYNMNVNMLPVIAQGAGPLTVAMTENGAWTAPALSATDAEGGTLTWSLLSLPGHGTAVVNGTGATPTSFEYTPDMNYDGTDTFAILVDDGNGGTLSIDVVVTVDGVNQGPELYTPGGVQLETLKDDLGMPRYMAVDGAGNLYTPDSDDDVVYKYDGSAWTVLTDASDTVAGEFDKPMGIVVDASGRVYVSDRYDHVVYRFNSDGTLDQEWGTSESSGSGVDEFDKPFGMAIDPSGNLYVADLNNDRIKKFDGSTWSVFVGTGLAEPHDVEVDALGNVYVADKDNDMIRKYDSSGTLLLSWDSSAGASEDLVDARSISIDGNSLLHVAHGDDEDYQPFYVFDTDGNFQYEWGRDELERSFDVAFDSDGYGYVCDSELPAVYKYSYNPALGETVEVRTSENNYPVAFALTLNARDAEGDTPLTWNLTADASHGTATASGTGDSMTVTYVPDTDYVGQDSFEVSVGDGSGEVDSVTVLVTVLDLPAWGAAQVVNSDAGSDGDDEQEPYLATDGAGNWIASWRSMSGYAGNGNDIVYSRSTDNGTTWSAMALLDSNSTSHSGWGDFRISMATDRAGTWMAVWNCQDNELTGANGTDGDIAFAVSTDSGATWSTPVAVNSNADTDVGEDYSAEVASDGAGNWLVTWVSFNDLDGNGTDRDIFYSISSDDGASWSAVDYLNDTAIGLDTEKWFPKPVSGGAGIWVVAWEAQEVIPGVYDYDIVYTRSTDNGATWSSVAPVNSNFATDSEADTEVRIATNGTGTWIAAWQSEEDLGGAVGTDTDIFYTVSTDNAATWRPVAVLNSNAQVDISRPYADEDCSIAYDADADMWVVVWVSQYDVDGLIGDNSDLLYAVSTDDGATWTDCAALADTHYLVDATDNGSWESWPWAVSGGSGQFGVLWNSKFGMDGTIENDQDVFFAMLDFSVTIDQGSTPLTVTMDEGGTWTPPVVSATDTDLSNTLTWSVRTQAGNGVVTVGGTGTSPTTFEYTPNPFFNGTDSFVIQVWNGDIADTIRVDVTVNPVNDPPLIADIVPGFTPMATLNTNAAGDAGDESHALVTTDENGVWVAAWYSNDDLGGTIDTDYDILYSVSTDGGTNWTAPAPLNNNAATDTGDDYTQEISTDGQGNWLATWESSDDLGVGLESDYDILYALSTDNCATWSDPAPLSSSAATDTAVDDDALITFLPDRWLVHWRTDGAGGDDDYSYAVSTDQGVTWTDMGFLNTNALSDSEDDKKMQIAADDAGNLIAVWYSYTNIGGSIGPDGDILYAVSMDSGDSWSAPAVLNTTAAADTGKDSTPQITTDGNGVWMVIWESKEDLNGAVGGDDDIFLSLSVNNGAVWSAPRIVNSNAYTDSGDDERVELTTDGNGMWIAVWCSGSDIDGAGTDDDNFYAYSIDNGFTWSSAAMLNSNANTDGLADEGTPELTADGNGNWIATWESDVDFDGVNGTDDDIYFATINLYAFPDVLGITISEDATPTAFTPIVLAAVDPEGDTPLTWSISSVASNGTASISDTTTNPTTLTYTPNTDYCGQDSFSVQVDDGNGGTDTMAVTVTVEAQQDPAMIDQTSPLWVTMSEDGVPIDWIAPTLTATDPDTADTLTWSVSSAASNGTATVSGTGASPPTFDYDPTTDWNGSDSFYVQVSDGASTDTITVNVTVNSVADVPTVTAWPEATMILGNTLATAAWTMIGAAEHSGAPVAGAFVFTSPGTTPSEGDYAASVLFTPADATNYLTVAGTVPVSVYAAGEAIPLAFTVGPIVDTVGDTSAVVAWETNRPATAVVDYAPSGGKLQTVVAGLNTVQMVQLTGLTAETEYSLTVTATDMEDESVTSHVVTFTTLAAPDLEGPQLLSGPAVLSVSDTTIVLGLSTDEPALVTVDVYSGGLLVDTVTGSTLAQVEAGIAIDGLDPEETYTFVITLEDEFGNTTAWNDMAGALLAVTTLAAPDEEAPVVVEGPIVETIGTNLIIMRWETDEPATTAVNYGSDGVMDLVAEEAGLRTQHRVHLTSLAPVTEYTLQASSTDVLGNGPTTSAEIVVTTLSVDEPDTSAPVFIVDPTVVGWSDTTATIYWQTNEPADTVVEYGEVEPLDGRASIAAKTLHHEVTLTGLTPGATYLYRCSSTDTATPGNTSYGYVTKQSSLPSFTTDINPDETAPTLTEGPELIVLNSDFASLRFVTNEIAGGSVTFWAVGDEANARTVTSLNYILEHIAALTSLTPETTYHYIVTVVDPSDNVGESAEMSFTTPAPGAADTAPPAFVSSAKASAVGETQATITWSTDTFTSGEVWYGERRCVFTKVASTAGLGETQEVLLADLKPCTSYFIRVVAVDQKQGSVASEGFWIETEGCEPDGCCEIGWFQVILFQILAFFAAIFGFDLHIKDTP